jgi:CBS domain containing-hemolysin-like protein
MSEIALISARKSRLESSAKKGNKSAQVALNLANSKQIPVDGSNWNYSYWYPYRYL